MTPERPRRRTAGIIGFGVAACAACCAGPVLAFLAAAGLLAAGAIAAFGAVGLLVAVPAAVLFHRRRTTRPGCATPPSTVPVPLLERPARSRTPANSTSDTGDSEAVAAR